MTDKTFKIEYKNYFNRLWEDFFPSVLMLIFICLLVFAFAKHYNTYVPFYMILLYSCVVLCIEFLRAKQFIHEIRILGNRAEIIGHNYDKLWNEIIQIDNTTIQIKHRRNGRFDYGLYLRLTYTDKNIDINKNLKWDYFLLIDLFNELKDIKNEKITFDEKYLLEIMLKKGHGLSNFAILLGKDIIKKEKPL
jgi:hypothetical protein